MAASHHRWLHLQGLELGPYWWEGGESRYLCSPWAAAPARCMLLLQFLCWMRMQDFQHWVIAEYFLSRGLVVVGDNFPQVFAHTHSAVQLGCLERVKRKAHKHDWVNICFWMLMNVCGGMFFLCVPAAWRSSACGSPSQAAPPGHLALRAATKDMQTARWHREIRGKTGCCGNLVP